MVRLVSPVRLLLLPRIGISRRKPLLNAVIFLDAGRLEVIPVDEDLVLLCVAQPAEVPLSVVFRNSWGDGPGEVGRAAADNTKRIIASTVEANRERVWRHPSNLGVLQGTSARVDVQLEWFFADLQSQLAMEPRGP